MQVWTPDRIQEKGCRKKRIKARGEFVVTLSGRRLPKKNIDALIGISPRDIGEGVFLLDAQKTDKAAVLASGKNDDPNADEFSSEEAIVRVPVMLDLDVPVGMSRSKAAVIIDANAPIALRIKDAVVSRSAFHLLEQYGSSTPDGMGAVPAAGKSWKYRTVKQLSKLDREGLKKGRLQEASEEDKHTRFYGTYNVSWSELTDQWVLRDGLVFVKAFANVDAALNSAKEYSGKEAEDENGTLPLRPVDMDSPISKSAAASASSAASTMGTPSMPPSPAMPTPPPSPTLPPPSEAPPSPPAPETPPTP